MATPDRSPSLFLGQSWASWADKMSITDGNDDEDDDKSDVKDEGDSMKLNKKDMDLFGFCPSREEFTLALCEICNMLIKPQALKRHIEIRHGPISAVKAALDEQAATSKVLNSELARTLSLPVTNFGKTSTTNKPPTKASLKQVPSSLRIIGSASGSAAHENANCRISSSSRPFRKGNTNPVVKVERMPKEVVSLTKVTTATASASCSPLRDVISSLPATVTTALGLVGRNAVISPNDSEKSLINDVIQKATVGTSQPSIPALSSTPFTTVATQPLALTTTTTSVTYTRPTPTTIPTCTATTTFALLNKTNKPVRTATLSSALAATLTATKNPLKANLHISTGGSKTKKSPKERKFLPCKDREFDANKHCGVVMDDTGKPCTRSLTCKTHALGLRRAVPGRKKSFDDLLREHKAAKEAMLKAKAEEQAAAVSGIPLAVSSGANTTPALVTAVTSPAALAAVSAIKLGHSDLSVHRDNKTATSTLLSYSALTRTVKPVRPSVGAVFQKIAPGGSFPAGLTIKEEPSPILDPSIHASQCNEKEGEIMQEKPDITYLSHHPRPAAVCTFGARIASGGCALFSRKTDLIRAALLSALEKQLNPPPHKKLCVESKLPKEPQMSSNSKDPYEFNMVDSGLGHQRQTVSFTIGSPVNANTGLLGKPLLKHKAKSLSSHSLNVTGLTVSSSVSGTPTSIAIPTLAAALLKPTKGQETSSVNLSTGGIQRGTLSLAQPLSSQAIKRKRCGSSLGSNATIHSLPSNTLQLKSSGVGLTVTSNSALGLTGTDGSRVSHQQSAVLTSVSSVNSHSATTPLTAITIPSVSLANAATIGLSATLPNSKQQGQKSNFIKDFNFVLTGIDPLVNGQYLNITGAQLAELAAAQAVSATAEDKNIKRSRLANTKHGTHKISGTIEALRALQGNSVIAAVPQNALLVDGSLQGTVLAPVSSLSGGASGGGNSTFVALTSGAITSSQSSSITVPPNTIFRTISSFTHGCLMKQGTQTNNKIRESGTPQQVTLTTASFANGIIPQSGDKVHAVTGSNHGQQQRIVNNIQGRAGSVPNTKTLQASGLIQQGASLCPSSGLTQLAHFKPGTFNITKGGKITMQPVSVTIPLVSPVGLGALATSQQQNSHSHPQPALLVTTSADDGRAGGGTSGAGKTEIHLQPQFSGASSGIIS